MWNKKLKLDQVDVMPELPDSLEELELYYCYNLHSIPKLPRGLKRLKIYRNNRPLSLPELPPGLETLILFGMRLAALPVFPHSLKRLQLHDVFIENTVILPALPDSVEILQLEYSGNFYIGAITNITSLPPNVKNLECANVSELDLPPKLPETLLILVVCGCELLSIPELPPHLTLLDCSNNHLTTIPALPNSLLYLSCYCNNLVALPKITGPLKHLNFENNRLIVMPKRLPHTLKYLRFNGCQIKRDEGGYYNQYTMHECHAGNNELDKWKEFRIRDCAALLKPRFVAWLWKARESIAKRRYHPDRIKDLLDQGVDIDDFDFDLAL